MSNFVRVAAVVVSAFALALLAAACGGDDKEGGLATGYPSAGDDNFELTRATVEIEYTFDNVAALPAAGELERIELEGPTRVTRSDPQDKDGDGRAEVVTEIVEMELKGTASFGPLTVRVNPDKSSTGMVEQQEPGKDFPADSFFDVFVQVELPSSGGDNVVLALNEQPLRLEAELSDLPPGEGDEYRTAGGDPVPLVAVNDATKRLGLIVDALHIPNPAPGPGTTAEPTQEPTAEPTSQPTPTATSAPGVSTASLSQEPGCEHTEPGVQSDLLDLIFAFLVSGEPLSQEMGPPLPRLVLAGSPGGAAAHNAAPALKEPLVGVSIYATAQGPGILQAFRGDVTGADGSVRLRFPINKLGAYAITVGTVQAPDRTLYALDRDSELNVTFEVGETCTKPEGF